MNNDQVAPTTNQRFSGVYALLARSGEGVYVGSSHRVLQRIDNHFKSLQRGRHHTRALQRAFDDGEQFDAVVLEQCGHDECTTREQVWMDTIGQLLNTSQFAIAGHSNRGQKRPGVADSNRRRTGQPWQPSNRAEWLARLSATKTGQKFGHRDPSVGKKIAASLRGKPMSAERRKKISLAHQRFHARLREQGLTQRRPRRTA